MEPNEPHCVKRGKIIETQRIFDVNSKGHKHFQGARKNANRYLEIINVIRTSELP